MAREQLRAMWEFPATHKLLSLLSRPLSFPPPPPSLLEYALLTPADHLPKLADWHGRLHGFSLGASSEKRWLSATAKLIRSRPDDFSHLTLPEFPLDERAYCALPTDVRLHVLHTLAELVLAEHDALLATGSLNDYAPDQLRETPVGRDTAGNQYWSFGDLQRVYRSPAAFTRPLSEKARRNKRLREDRERRDAEREKRDARRKENEQKREDVRRRREERQRKAAEKWAPRVAASRTTRASRRAEIAVMAAEAGGAQPANSQQADERPKRRTSARRKASAPATANSQQTDGEDEPGARRSSTRRRKAPGLDSPPPVAKRPRKAEPVHDDLRACEHWETVSTDSDSLREFVSRFGAREKLAPVERTLIKRLEDELLPAMVEAETRIRREAERKARTEFLLANQKRSTRVQMIAAKREEEARRNAQREEAEREEAERLAAHARRVAELMEFVVREQSRDIRSARRLYGRSEAIVRDDEALKKASHVRRIPAPVRRSSRATRGNRLQDGMVPSAEVELPIAKVEPKPNTVLKEDDTSEFQVEKRHDGPTGPQDERKIREEARGETAETSPKLKNEGELVKTLDVERSATDVSEANIPNTSLKSSSTEPERQQSDEGRGDERDQSESFEESAPDAMKGVTMPPSEQQSDVTNADRNVTRFSSGLLEQAVPDAFTWNPSPEDQLPTRVLDNFFFASRSDFADAPLENCDVPSAEIVGFGVLVPPTKSPADVVRVEISRVVEWMFEYGADPKLWIKSEHGWYELREAAVEYRDVFASARKKFELCVRVSILGETMRGPQLNYESIVDYLSYRYGNMRAYEESEILSEKRYIVSQMERLNRRSLMQSGFIKGLQKRIRNEERKAAAEKEKADRLLAKQEEVLPPVPALQQEKRLRTEKESKVKERAKPKIVQKKEKAAPDAGKGITVKAISKKPARRRSSSTGKPVVPRAVSSIISGLLRAATRSYKPPRKKRVKPDLADAVRGPMPSPSARGPVQVQSRAPAQANGVAHNSSTETNRQAGVTNGVTKAKATRPAQVNGLHGAHSKATINDPPQKKQAALATTYLSVTAKHQGKGNSGQTGVEIEKRAGAAMERSPVAGKRSGFARRVGDGNSSRAQVTSSSPKLANGNGVVPILPRPSLPTANGLAKAVATGDGQPEAHGTRPGVLTTAVHLPNGTS